jgi:TolA-binding protein
MNPIDIGGILVAIVAALGAWAAQRSAAKASAAGSRFEAEKEAYERARDFDTETINRLKEENQELRGEIKTLKDRIQALEMGKTLEDLLHDRLKEPESIDPE